jgi:hypothetical protein
MATTVILRGQPELRAVVKGPGGEPVRDWRRVFLAIKHPTPPPGGEDTRIVREGFWPGFPPAPRPDQWNLPPTVYQADDLTPRLELVFRLDDELWRRPPGRYEGTIFVRGCPAAWLDIDLRDQRWLPRETKVRTIP